MKLPEDKLLLYPQRLAEFALESHVNTGKNKQRNAVFTTGKLTQVTSWFLFTNRLTPRLARIKW